MEDANFDYWKAKHSQYLSYIFPAELMFHTDKSILSIAW